MVKRKRLKTAGLALLLLCAVSCSVYTKPQKLEDYLHYVEFENYNFEKLSKAADMLFDKKKKMPGAACSAIRKDSLFGRNFDWFYDEMPEFVIMTRPAPGRYASIGMAAPLAVLKDNEVGGTLKGSVVLNILPVFTVDGINEKGVACCINVVPQGDSGFTVGTNPGKPRMYAALFVRYVLDKASSAEEAVRLLDDVDIYTSTAYGLTEDYHFMIADSVSTYVVEFVDNRSVVLEGERMITNYNISGGVSPHAMGLERMDILRKGEGGACGKDGMLDLLESVWFTGMYDENEAPVWLSELCSGNDGYGLTTDVILSDPEKFKEAFETERKKYLERSREKSGTWQTVHSSIYNLFTKTLSVHPQESRRSYCFELRP